MEKKKGKIDWYKQVLLLNYIHLDKLDNKPYSPYDP